MAKNRIVETSVHALEFDNANFNKGTQYGAHLLEESIGKFGLGRSILIDKNNRIIAGNKTVENAGAMGMEDVLIVETTGNQIVAVKRTDIDLDTKEGREMAMADNATSAANLAWDADMIFAKAEEFGIEPGEWGIDIGELNPTQPEASEDDFQGGGASSTDESRKTKKGDIWILGEHRLICGDSTEPDVWKALMRDDRADMVFTDPPYNVAIGDKNAALNEIQKSNRITENIAGDAGMTDEQCGRTLWLPAFTNMRLYANECCGFYVTMPQGATHMMMMMMMGEAGWQVKHELVWVKNSPTFSMGRLDYDYQHEPILYGWNKKHKFSGNGEFTKSVWHIDKPTKCDLHPTMKPVQLVANAILNSSDLHDVVVDGFGGSGTTLIACEQLERRCRMVEFDPHYCDVIVARWEELTGETATKQS